MQNCGVFNISLDFELHWGCFESKRELDQTTREYFNNTRMVIPQMLSLFEEHAIHVTWATVGMLFSKNIKDWEAHIPAVTPDFYNHKVSAYEWVKEHGFFSEKDPFHFAPDLIERIKSTPHQEIGTHTYAHYFCLEEGQTLDHFREDIRMACEVSRDFGIEIKSLVFPRNQFNKEYLSVCDELGITAVRSNPKIWYWSPSTASGFFRRLFRSGDAYLKIQPIKMVYLKDIDTKQFPLQLPASRLYRPWSPKYAFANKLKMNRILNEMTRAAKEGAYYHLWWHPHNLGNHPLQCMEELKRIIQHFIFLKKKYNFQSLTMAETTNLLLHNKK